HGLLGKGVPKKLGAVEPKIFSKNGNFEKINRGQNDMTTTKNCRYADFRSAFERARPAQCMSNNGYCDKEVIKKLGAVGKEKCSKNKEKEQISQADKNETNGFYADFRSAFTRNERVELGNNNGYCHNEATRNIERGKKPKTSKIDEKRQISNIAAGRKSDHYEYPSSAFSRISIDHCNAQIKIGRKKMVRNLRSSEPQKISRFPRHHGEGKKVSPPALNLQWPGQKQVASAVAPQIRKSAAPKKNNTNIHRNCRKHLRKEGDWWIVEGGQSHKKAAHSPLKTKQVNKEGNRKKYGRPPREVEGKWLTSLIAATTEAVLRQLGKGKSPTAHTKSNQSRVPLQHSEKTAKGIKHATPQPKKKAHEQRKELPRRPPNKRSHGANKGQGAPVRAPAKTQGKGEEQPHTMRTWAQVAAPKKQKVTSKPPMAQKKGTGGKERGSGQPLPLGATGGAASQGCGTDTRKHVHSLSPRSAELVEHMLQGPHGVPLPSVRFRAPGRNHNSNTLQAATPPGGPPDSLHPDNNRESGAVRRSLLLTFGGGGYPLTYGGREKFPPYYPPKLPVPEQGDYPNARSGIGAGAPHSPHHCDRSAGPP
ncbi:SLACS retrotransposable element (part), putative, partial [Trypanosoma brucei gambiense DAL972]